MKRSDSGFTLVEVIVAMGIAALTLTALLGATINGARASVEARINQQAADVLTKTLEDLRSLDYGAVAMADYDLTGDPSIAAASGSPYCPPSNYCWRVPNVEPVGEAIEDPEDGAIEPIVAAPTGAVTPHITTVTANANNVTFTLSRYITAPAEGNTVRATAVVKWSLGGAEHTRTSSTIIANTRRGLPLPKFALSSSGPTALSISPGSEAQLPFIIKNLGARDSFDLRVMAADVAESGWVFYPDATCAGSLDPEVTTAPLAMHEGVYITPDLYPDSITCFIAAKTIDTAGTYVYTIRAQSTKQPAADTAVIVSKPVTVVVQSGLVVPTPTPTPTESPDPSESPSETPTESPSPTPSPSTTTVCATPSTPPTPPNTYTLRRFVLLNDPPGDTPTKASNPMQRDDCTVQSSLHAYSTNLSGDIGRVLATGGSTSSGGGSAVAEWRWQASVITEFSGDAQVVFAYRCDSGSASFQVAIGHWNHTNNTYTAAGDTTSTVSCTGDWRTAEVSLSVSKFSVRSKSGAGAIPTYLDLRIAAPTGTDVRLNYDTATAPSTLFIGSKP